MRLSLFMFILLLAIPAAHAEDYIYAPENCAFTMTFPSEPYISRHCNPLDPKDCQRVTSYTKVFDMNTSVNFSVTCNPLEEAMFERYTTPVMETALTAMASAKDVNEYETGSQQKDTIKQSVLMGTGQTGNSDMLYVSQIWLSPTSLMTLESELIGNPTEEQEEHFALILRSVQPKKNGKPASGEDSEGTDTDSEEASAE